MSKQHKTQNDVTTEATKLFRELTLITDDEAARITICDQILKLIPNDVDAVQHKVVSLINTNRFDDAIKTIVETGLQEELSFERAYAFYRLNNTSESLRILREAKSMTEAHSLLLAQIQNKSENFADSSKTYLNIVEHKQNERIEIDPEYYCNLLASSLHCDSDVVSRALRITSQNDSWDLCYNMACTLIPSRKWSEALSLLYKCEEQCESQGWDDAQLQDELCVVHVQKAFVLHQLGQQSEAKALLKDVLNRKPSSVQANVAACNNLTALHHRKDLFDSMKRMKYATQSAVDVKLTTRQRMVIKFNSALLLLFIGKRDACRSAAEVLIQQYPDNDFGPLLMASVYFEEGKWIKAEDVLKTFTRLNAGSECTVRVQLALAQIQLRQNNIPAAIQSLHEMPCLEQKLGVIAAIVGLYKRTNQIDAAIKLFDNSINAYDMPPSTPVLRNKVLILLSQAAQFKLKEKRFQDAANTYKRALEIQPDDTALLAGLVVTLSNFDIDESEQYAKRLPPVVNTNKVTALLRDSLSLKEIQIPRDVAKMKETMDTKKKLKQDISAMAADLESRKKKRKEKKKANKKRKRRASAKIMDGNPDPERWLPIKERSTFKKTSKKLFKKKPPPQQTKTSRK